MKHIFLLFITLSFICAPSLAEAEVRLPEIFSSHMVIQRGQPIKIWGWADKQERIEVQFNGQNHKIRANSVGRWELTLSPMEAGGPYSLIVQGKHNSMQYDDILIGEVWLCSGQSNMEWSVSLAGNATQEIEAANYPDIRTFNVPKRLSWTQAEQTPGTWEVCSSETAGHFSAVAYYFARDIYKQLGIPVGIINSSWGGSAIESWISSEAYLALPNQVRKAFDPAIIASVEEYSTHHPESLDGYSEYMLKDPGMTACWSAPQEDDFTWNAIQNAQQSTELFGVEDGLIWFRHTFELPAAAAGKAATLHLGRIDDNDITWVNGAMIGRMDGHTFERKYDIPAGLLKAGQNTITVRITDELGLGGFMDTSDKLYVETVDETIPLVGAWKWRKSVTGQEFFNANLGPNTLYSMLYNAMISPLKKLRIQGAIWYQGESNADRAEAYRTLFPTMITDWRDHWGYDFPFYWVQLPNFMAKDETPTESPWAELREAQHLTLSLPQTGEAVIIDLGEQDNIHPANKQDVGKRLAQLALNKTYGRNDLACSGPTFDSMQVQGNKAIISFDPHGSGLKVRNKYGYIEGFAIAGADRKFVWAKAHLQGSKVVVSSDEVEIPVAVRFAWGNNPEVNLYNTEDLPAAPFRTDSW